MKKIMFFILSLKMGGSEKACVRMANALCTKYDVTVVTLFGGGELLHELSPAVKIKTTFPRFIRGISRIVGYLPPKLVYKLFVRERFDIEIAVGDGLESHILSGSANSDTYSWIHMDVRYNGARPSEKTKKRYSSFKKIICVSETARQAFHITHGCEEKTAVAYTPVDATEIQSLANAPCDFPDNTMISVGRLEAVKGYDKLIEAVSLLNRKDFRLWIYGDGTKRSELQSLIDEKGLQEQIILKGMAQNPYPAIKQANALICSSLNESFGFTVVEAMLLHTPVISTRCGGPEEIIEEATEGILCESSAAGLKNSIADFLDKNTSVDTQNAYLRAKQFNVTSCAEQFIKILEE